VTWEGLLERLVAAGLNPVEVTYMENYGKLLSSKDSRFRGRQFRCTYGAINVNGLGVEVLLFPSEIHRSEFLEIAGQSPWRAAAGNALLAFDRMEFEIMDRVLGALGVE
jgi:hypothetical protein